MTRFVCGAGLAVVLALGGAAVGQEPDSPFDPAKLIGRWEPESPKKDATSVFEFVAGGKFVVKAGVGGKTETWQGTYTVAGQKLKLKLKVGEKTIDEELVVLRLTDAQLETEDAKGKKEMLRRLP
ncbi:MAG TPA: TIGR03066 family protein [Urbifossiella sp.]|jgi:uncharacterized protein (TIGR03066 family)|nr:TIGR03066 family protein [Urbifossiella sp.]